MEDKYSIEDLIKTFDRHSQEFEIYLKDQKEKYPEREVVQDDFNLSKALHSICLYISILLLEKDEK